MRDFPHFFILEWLLRMLVNRPAYRVEVWLRMSLDLLRARVLSVFGHVLGEVLTDLPFTYLASFPAHRGGPVLHRGFCPVDRPPFRAGSRAVCERSASPYR